jgi:hypothetical protein
MLQEIFCAYHPPGILLHCNKEFKQLKNNNINGSICQSKPVYASVKV